MADTKISALVAASVAAVGNELAINEVGTSKKVTITQIKTLLQTLGMPRVTVAGSQHSISSTTGTIVAGLSQTLEVGTYRFEYYLILRTATLTVSPLIGVNFTGIAAAKSIWFEYADLSSTLLAAIGTMTAVGTTAVGFGMRSATQTYTTTAPNMGNSSAATNRVNATATDFLVKVSGVIVVTGSGSLDLYHSSQTNTATSVEAASSLSVIRVS